jgi:hypothetical protein
MQSSPGSPRFLLPPGDPPAASSQEPEGPTRGRHGRHGASNLPWHHAAIPISVQQDRFKGLEFVSFDLTRQFELIPDLRPAILLGQVEKGSFCRGRHKLAVERHIGQHLT